MNCQVTDLDFNLSDNVKVVENIHLIRDGKKEEIATSENDFVFITIGSMTADSSLGSMTAAPRLKSRKSGGSWALWEILSNKQPDFGRPSVFSNHIEQSLWESFSLTLNEPTFFALMRDFTGDEAGTGAW